MTDAQAFIEKWREPLEAGAAIRFASGVPIASNHAAMADGFVAEQGLQKIGYNWELLDAFAAPDEPRSAVGAMAEALAQDMEYPQREWLGPARARECAGDFVALFDPAQRSFVSNRMGDLWNPLTDARIEWGFIGFDAQRIALLLATR